MKSEIKNVIELNGCILGTDDILFNFAIYQKPSSNVEYFGLDYACEKIFVQFKSGSSFIYSDVPKILLDASKVAPSIGKFVSSCIVGKFISEKYTVRLVQIISTEANQNNNNDPSKLKADDKPSF